MNYVITRTFNATEWAMAEDTGRPGQDIYVSEDGRSMRPVLRFVAPSWQDAFEVYEWAQKHLDWRWEKGVKTWAGIRLLMDGPRPPEENHAQLALAFQETEAP